nr:hypothetical protein CFP56_58760 [Quercus suber]
MELTPSQRLLGEALREHCVPASSLVTVRERRESMESSSRSSSSSSDIPDPPFFFFLSVKESPTPPPGSSRPEGRGRWTTYRVAFCYAPSSPHECDFETNISPPVVNRASMNRKILPWFETQVRCSEAETTEHAGFYEMWTRYLITSSIPLATERNRDSVCILITLGTVLKYKFSVERVIGMPCSTSSTCLYRIICSNTSAERVELSTFSCSQMQQVDEFATAARTCLAYQERPFCVRSKRHLLGVSGLALSFPRECYAALRRLSGVARYLRYDLLHFRGEVSQ